jgi:molybdopterin molybdotransferase
MLQVTQARERLLKHFHPGQTETVTLIDAAGRVLADTVSAENDSPPFSHSSMDGVAVRFDDLQRGAGLPISLRVIGKIAAGENSTLRLNPGESALIMTGAQLPAGADTVIRVEDTNLDFSAENKPGEVEIRTEVSRGENIRVQGENYQVGKVVFSPGHKVRPQDVGMMAMLGKSVIPVYKRPVVGIFATGDELVEPGNPLQTGQIWNSNSSMIGALVEDCGGTVVDLGIVRDTLDGVHSAFDTLIARSVDLILTSGGVSMGMHDYIRRIIEKYGEINFWKVNMRPGKPLAFGHYRDVPFIGLPGNPVSSFMGAQIFVCPAIHKMSGRSWSEPMLFKARLDTSITSDGRESYIPGWHQLDGEGMVVAPVGNQSSGNLFALVQGNCLIKIAPGVQSLKQDSIVEIWKFT